MLRVIFDTNIYGRLLNESDREQLEEKIRSDKKFIVYGYNLIRKEIRDIRKVTKASKQTRILLLGMYDRITGNHFLEHSIKITNLAMKYYNAYRNFGGIYNWKTNIRVDFMIVACASFHGLDIVYSADKKTLGGKIARKAYKIINAKETLRTPDFFTYQLLVKKFRGLL